jgi:hypothetical protein
MVLLADRGAEDRHDPVAGELVDGALDRVDGLGGEEEEALEQRPPGVRAEALGEAHRADDVDEHDRDLLRLAVGELPADAGGADGRGEGFGPLG